MFYVGGGRVYLVSKFVVKYEDFFFVRSGDGFSDSGVGFVLLVFVKYFF